MKKWMAGVMAGLWVLSACASTKIKASWKDPAFNVNSMRHVLVMAVVPQSTSQRVVEDAFVRKLSKHSAQGVASYSVSPAEAKLDEASWKRLIAEKNVDAVLVVRLVDVKTVEREVPPTNVNTGYMTPAYGTHWYGYYQNSYQVVTTPGYTIKDTIAVAETKLWDVPNEKLVWTGSTHTQVVPDQDTGAMLEQYADVIVSAIYK